MKNPIALAIVNFLIRVRNLVVHEFPVIVAVVIAAATAAAGATPAGFVVAVAVALLRFVVSPAFTSAAVKDRVIPPTVAELVNIAVAEKLAALEAPAKVAVPAVVSAPEAESVAPVAVEDAPFTPAT